MGRCGYCALKLGNCALSSVENLSTRVGADTCAFVLGYCKRRRCGTSVLSGADVVGVKVRILVLVGAEDVCVKILCVQRVRILPGYLGR